MKCQKCEKPATFHITELTGGKLVELHFCEDHAREYLTQASDTPVETTTVAKKLAQHMAKHMAVGQTAEELAELDQQTCPVCGISFYEFRSQGRLGCPHDYVFFEEQLKPLVLNIHGATEHSGKASGQYPEGTDGLTQVVRMRREMMMAVEAENYERAGQLRDEIRRLEEGGPSSQDAPQNEAGDE